MHFSFDENLRDIADKVEDGERLTFDDGLALYATSDLNALGKLADHVRRRKHGLTTYYNVNRHFNHTNICVADCKFCGFYKRARQEGAYTHSVQEGVDIARAAGCACESPRQAGHLAIGWRWRGMETRAAVGASASIDDAPAPASEGGRGTRLTLAKPTHHV